MRPVSDGEAAEFLESKDPLGISPRDGEREDVRWMTYSSEGNGCAGEMYDVEG